MKTKVQTLLLMLACLAGPANAAVTFTITPSAVSNTYTGTITLLISNVPTGDTVVVQKFLDLNTNGIIDGSDWLVQQFQLTDGTNFVIGGVTNFNVPGDLNATTGAITATLNFQNGNFMQDIVGKYLFKLSSPAGHFTPITNAFAVTNFPFGQKFTGNVVSNGTSTVVSNAVVLLLSGPAGQSSPLAGTVANNAGQYTIQVPAGTYSPVAFRSNYLGNFSTAPLLTLGSLATITTNLTVTNATSSISGRLVDTANPSLGLPGIFLPIMSTNGMIGVGFTDTNGNFTVGVRAGQWSIKPDENGMALHGYLELSNDTNVNAGATGVIIALPRVNALIYGSVKDILGNPMPGIDVYIQAGPTNADSSVDSYTDTNGNYVAGVAGGTNEIWIPTIDTEYENPNLTNYVFTQFTNYDFVQLNGNVSTNTAVPQNFVGMLATNHIYGSVKTTTTNVVGVGVSAIQNIGGANFWTWTHTDTNGNYVLNVGNGTWDLSVYCSASGYGDDLATILGAGNYVCPNDQFPTINNNNATNNFVVQTCGGIAIVTASPLPVGEVNAFYNQPIQASDCNGTYNWSQTGGALPGNLSLYSGGQFYSLSGYPTNSGTFTFTVQVDDGSTTTNSQQFSVTISNALQITTTSLPNGTNGSAYSQQLQATGGQPPYTNWFLVSGSPPPNLALSNNGLISGNAAGSGTFTFTVGLSDILGGTNSQQLSLTINTTNPPPPVGIASANGQMLIYYPTSGSNYVLQTATNLNGPWSNASNGVPAVSFYFSNTAPVQFFRLH